MPPPLYRSHGLVDFVHLTIFPVLTGQTGTDPVFKGAADSIFSGALRQRYATAG
ncbi:hypothetical protein [Actinoplanes italicus]|uniref:hypothetical protein n=1 Tax=Actinoplanes italicus TaxID=113567 RepID=UPI0014728FC1|nr:hypothetical protein [Actinoplanes italicus]